MRHIAISTLLIWVFGCSAGFTSGVLKKKDDEGDRIDEQGEGLPGFLVDPSQVRIKTVDDAFIVSGPPGAVDPEKASHIDGFKVCLAVRDLGQLQADDVLLADPVGNTSPEADGSFQLTVNRQSLGDCALVITLAEVDGELRPQTFGDLISSFIALDPGEGSFFEALVVSQQNDAEEISDTPSKAVLPVVEDLPTDTTIWSKRHVKCTSSSENGVLCWGRLQDLYHGEGGSTDFSSPVEIPWSDRVGEEVPVAMSLNVVHGCMVTGDGSVACWGRESYGKLGRGAGDSVPLTIQKIDQSHFDGAKIKSITTGTSHSCALSEDGVLYCWGRNFEGATGQPDSTGPSTESPLPVVLGVFAGELIEVVDAEWENTCFVTDAGRIGCVGINNYGQLGQGSLDPALSATALEVELPGVTATDVCVTNRTVCALGSDEQIYCWGSNDAGQLGLPETTEANYNPSAIDTSHLAEVPTFVDLECGEAHVVALTADGRGFAWGDNSHSNLGVGSKAGTVYQITEVDTSQMAAKTFAKFFPAGWSSCAAATDDKVYCWGSNSFNALQIGEADRLEAPTEFSFD